MTCYITHLAERTTWERSYVFKDAFLQVGNFIFKIPIFLSTAFPCIRCGIQTLPTEKVYKTSCKGKKNYFSPCPGCSDPGKSRSLLNLSLGKLARLKKLKPERESWQPLAKIRLWYPSHKTESTKIMSPYSNLALWHFYEFTN